MDDHQFIEQLKTKIQRLAGHCIVYGGGRFVGCSADSVRGALRLFGFAITMV